MKDDRQTLIFFFDPEDISTSLGKKSLDLFASSSFVGIGLKFLWRVL
jgi:hypothetical protein